MNDTTWEIAWQGERWRLLRSVRDSLHYLPSDTLVVIEPIEYLLQHAGAPDLVTGELTWYDNRLPDRKAVADFLSDWGASLGRGA